MIRSVLPIVILKYFATALVCGVREKAEGLVIHGLEISLVNIYEYIYW